MAPQVWGVSVTARRKRLLLTGTVLFCLLPAFWPAIGQQERGLQVTARAAPSGWGNYWALIVGINKYQEWPRLDTAVQDAQVLKGLLEAHYGFSPERVVLRLDGDATLSQLLRDLREMSRSLGPEDNWLIYFAGHGQIDDLTGDGYWIPADGKVKDVSTWLGHQSVRGILGSEKVQARSICVVADSCYAGTLLRGGPGPLDLGDHRYLDKLRELAARRSRQVITSGAKEPVVDGGRDGHSLFAYYFLNALRENERPVVDLENLFHTKVWKPVSEISGQRPGIGRLRTPMDEDGQFVLVRRDLPPPVVKVVAPPPITIEREPLLGTLVIVANRTGVSVYLDGQRIGETEAGARLRFRNIPVGEHTVSASLGDREVSQQVVRVEEGKETLLRVDVPEEKKVETAQTTERVPPATPTIAPTRVTQPPPQEAKFPTPQTGPEQPIVTPAPQNAAPPPQPTGTIPVESPSSAPSATTHAKPTYTGPSAGRVLWTGQLPKNSRLTIEGRRASTGSVIGTLPGVPVNISAYSADLSNSGLTVYTSNLKHSEPASRANGWYKTEYVVDGRRAADVKVLESPGARNGWNRVVLHNGIQPVSVVVIDWEVQSAERR